MRIVVAGAAGFIGYHLCHRLLGEGHSVIGIDNFVSGRRVNADDLSRDPNFRLVEADIGGFFEIRDPVDQVYNMACPASPVDFRDKSIEIMHTCSAGVAQLLELARAKHARFLQASTSECYGDPLEHPQRESYRGNVSTTGPRACYDEGKRFGEALTMCHHRRYGVATRIVRIFNTYGPRMRTNDGRALPTFITQALRNEPVTVHGDGRQTRSFCYVTDLVEGIVRLMASDFIEPVNIGNDEEITVRQFADEVIRIAGSSSPITFVDRPGDDPERRRPDLTRAREILGWTPAVSRERGLTMTIEDFRAAGARPG